MTERPILFSGPMVRAILAGTKTVTRRLVKPAPVRWVTPREECATTPEVWQTTGHSGRWSCHGATGDETRACPFGVPGDRLWVRETWAAVHFSAEYVDGFPTGYSDDWEGSKTIPKDSCDGYWVPQYAADPHHETSAEDRGWAWRPSIHMPRWASRLTLEVVSVRVERLQEITEEDARAEGITNLRTQTGPTTLAGRPWATESRLLWDSINGERASWESNPWVWRVEFTRMEAQ